MEHNQTTAPGTAAKRITKAEWVAEEFGGHKGEHPALPVADWKIEVENDDTRLGYWDWVVARLEE